jgi:hypothetical protein
MSTFFSVMKRMFSSPIPYLVIAGFVIVVVVLSYLVK